MDEPLEEALLEPSELVPLVPRVVRKALAKEAPAQKEVDGKTLPEPHGRDRRCAMASPTNCWLEVEPVDGPLGLRQKSRSQ